MLRSDGTYVVEFIETRSYRVPFAAESVEDATNQARAYIAANQSYTDAQTEEIKAALIASGVDATYDNLGFSINRITPRYVKDSYESPTE